MRFEVRSYTRASNLLDRIALGTIGQPLRRATWESFVEEVVRRSGGEAVGGVQTASEKLTDEDAAGVEQWVEELVRRREQREASA